MTLLNFTVGFIGAIFESIFDIVKDDTQSSKEVSAKQVAEDSRIINVKIMEAIFFINKPFLICINTTILTQKSALVNPKHNNVKRMLKNKKASRLVAEGFWLCTYFVEFAGKLSFLSGSSVFVKNSLANSLVNLLEC